MKNSYDPVLPWSLELQGKKCEPVTEFGESSVELTNRMKASMFYLHGQGLAAPQIGIFRRAAIIYYEDKVFPIFNPEIYEADGNEAAYEACLSIPGASSHYGRLQNQARVERATMVKVRYQDVTGAAVDETLNGHKARVVQHEIDHLDGLFFIDRTGKMFRNIVLNRYQNWRDGCERGAF